MLFIQYPSWLKPEIISGLPIRWYGLMYLCAFVTAYLFVVIVIKNEKKEITLIPHISNIVFWMIVGILIGGRVVSEIIYNKNLTILLQPWLLFWPFDSSMNFIGIQGMSYHGGLLGGLLGGIIYCRRKRLPIWEIMDKFSIGASLGYGFGRLGNFANAELYGRITNSPLGMIFPYAQNLPYGDDRVKSVADSINLQADAFGLVNLPRHPSQLYEAFFESLVLFFILYFLYKKIHNTKRYAPGMFFALYTIGYGLARFFVEYFRQPDPQLGFIISFSKTPNPIWLFVSPFNFTMGQLLSTFMIIIGIFMLFLFYKIKQNRQVFLMKK